MCGLAPKLAEEDVHSETSERERNETEEEEEVDF